MIKKILNFNLNISILQYNNIEVFKNYNSIFYNLLLFIIFYILPKNIYIYIL